MKIITLVTAGAMLALPMLLTGTAAHAATAAQYSAAGHGKAPSMSRFPSRQKNHPYTSRQLRTPRHMRHHAR